MKKTIALFALGLLAVSSNAASLELWGDVTAISGGYNMVSDTTAQGYASIGYANDPRTAIMLMSGLTDLSIDYEMIGGSPFAGGSPRFSLFFGTPGGGGVVPADYFIFAYWSNPVNTTPAPGVHSTGNAMDVNNSSITFESNYPGFGPNTYFNDATTKGNLLAAISGYSLRSMWVDLDAGWSQRQEMNVSGYRINGANMFQAVPEPFTLSLGALSALAYIRKKARKS